MKQHLPPMKEIGSTGRHFNPAHIESWEPLSGQSDDKDDVVIIFASGQKIVMEYKEFDPEGYKTREDAKEKARREQEAKDLAEIERIAKEKQVIANGGDETNIVKRGPKPKLK